MKEAIFLKMLLITNITLLIQYLCAKFQGHSTSDVRAGRKSQNFVFDGGWGRGGGGTRQNFYHTFGIRYYINVVNKILVTPMQCRVSLITKSFFLPFFEQTHFEGLKGHEGGLWPQKATNTKYSPTLDKSLCQV